MKLLITGGAGFIGSYLCEKYTLEGHTVLCLDNFITGNLSNIRPFLNTRHFKLINGDVRTYDLLEKIMRDVDAVIHMAAQIHVDRSILEPRLTYDVNVFGTLNILELARRYDVEKVIHASTSEVYGSAEYAPMDEQHPLNAPHPYGASKIAADRMCHAYIQAYGLDVCILRPFNTYGPKQKDFGYGGAISIFVKRVLRDMPPTIFGDGTQTRDYMYVKDLVRAFDLTLKHDKPIRQPLNFGTGVEIAIIDLANMVIKLCNKKGRVQPVHISARPGEVTRLVADYTRAKELFGWEPQYNLETGLTEFIQAYKNYRMEEWEKVG